jgi:uncharacterized DUF497 family protein
MTEAVAGFDWNDGNRDKCLKHGVTVEEIESAFRGGTLRVLPDPAHSATETRCLGIGLGASGRHVLVAFTYREIEKQRFIRRINARYMHTKEIKHYEAQSQDPTETASTQD